MLLAVQGRSTRGQQACFLVKAMRVECNSAGYGYPVVMVLKSVQSDDSVGLYTIVVTY